MFEDFSGVLVAYPGNGSFFIENVAVRPEQQGQGLGRRLLDFAEQLCREHGFAELRLYTHVKMTENRAMYAHMGYTEVDRRHEHGFERVYMLKRLTPKAAAQR